MLKTNLIAYISLRTKKEKPAFYPYVAFNFFGSNQKKKLSTMSHLSSLKIHCTFRLFVNVITIHSLPIHIHFTKYILIF